VRRTRINPYSQRRRAKFSEMAVARQQCLQSAGMLCEARLEVCTIKADHAHHVLSRARGGSDAPENLKALCLPCHGFIHANPEWAKENGLLRSAACVWSATPRTTS
jgi:5-methylcytosine-specific restriction endonuclease McrA